MQDKRPFKPEHPRIKITDFGFATYLSEDNETLNFRLGSARYKSPELVDSRNREWHNEKVDIWAIGCIVFEMFAGSPAFNQQGVQAIN